MFKIRQENKEEFLGNTPVKYRKKPIPIRAVKILSQAPNPAFEVDTLEGTMTGNSGDYLVEGIEGEIYPVKGEIFEKSYEEVK